MSVFFIHFNMSPSRFPCRFLPLQSASITHTHTPFPFFCLSAVGAVCPCLCFVRQGSGTAVVAASGLSIGGD